MVYHVLYFSLFTQINNNLLMEPYLAEKQNTSFCVSVNRITIACCVHITRHTSKRCAEWRTLPGVDRK